MDDLEKIEHEPCVAAMDLGTNSSRLLIVDEKGAVVYRDVKHVALGDGLAENKHFCEQAMERAICSFMDFAEMMKVYNVKSYRAIATAACRMSANTAEFKKEVKNSSGIDIEVISEFEEARLTLKGACLNAPKEPKYLIVYDLGGGSTEVTFATNEATPKILETYSIPLGARNATEMYQLKNYNEKRALELEEEVKHQLSGLLAKIKTYPNYADSAVIATSSTPLRLAALILQLPGYDKFEADGKTVSVKDLDEKITELLSWPEEKRAQSIYIGPNRAGIFIAACVIFRAIYHEVGAKKIIASLKGAQEAIVRELNSAC